jgi:hypothetical protein
MSTQPLLPNGLVVTDSSKQVRDYQIKTYPVGHPSLVSKIAGPSVAGLQLVSIANYLYRLANAAGQNDAVLPRLLVAAQCVEFC